MGEPCGGIREGRIEVLPLAAEERLHPGVLPHGVRGLLGDGGRGGVDGAVQRRSQPRVVTPGALLQGGRVDRGGE